MHAATSSTLNFNARLQNASGSLVADGSYSIQFKLYDAVSAGTNEWTETETVSVKNGYLSANLGSVTPFSGSIDWSQEKWLTMNVNSDGEMNPRIKLTGVPFAFRSGLTDAISTTGGPLTGDNILQKAPSSVQSVSSANAGLRFNQTGAGGLLQLQGGGLDVFTVSKTGDVSAAGGLTVLGGGAVLGTSTQAGSLTLSDGSSNTGILSTAALSSDRTYALPDVSGTICLTSTCGAGASFNQNGSAFGVDGVLGVTDNHALRIITNNTEKMTILANGNVGIGDTTPAALFTVGTGDALQVDASGNLSTSGTITSGLINGQTIGSTANFTGSLTAAGLITANGGVSFGSGQTLTINGDALTDLTGTGLSVSGGVLNLANTAITPGSYGSQSSVATFTVDQQGRLTAAGSTAIGNLANAALQNSSFGVSFGSNLSGSSSVALGGTLSVNISATPTFTTLNTTGALTAGNGFTVTTGGASINGGLNLNSSAISGVTTLGLSGAITGTTTNTINGLSINSGALSGVTGFGQTSGAFSVTGTGNITLGGGSNALVIDSTNFDVSSAGALSGITSINMSGVITANTTNTINGLSINSGALSGVTGITFTSGNLNLNGGNIQNAGTIQAAGGKLNVNGSGSVTAAFTVLNGSTTATSGSGLTPGTINVGAGNTANFDVGNYVLVNGTYAKITAKTASALTISPNLSWSASATVVEYYIPEIGGDDTTSTLTNRFGRGYFISGVATGNGTTYYNEDSITTNLASFDLLNTNATTINFGGATTTLNIGNASSTVNVLGNLQTSASQTITAGGGLTVTNGGINNNGGGITNAGTISGVTGITFTSGSLNLANGGIINTGSLAGVTSITASGTISANTTGTINGLNVSSGALSGITGYGQTSGAFSVTGTGTVTIGGGSNALTIDSTNFDVSSAGAVSGITSITASGTISANTTGTINGLNVSSGALSGVTGFSQGSGNFGITGSGTFGTGTGAISLNGVTTVTGTNAFNVNGGLTSLGAGLTVTGVSNLGTQAYIPGTSGTSAQGYFTGSATTKLGGLQSLDLGGNTYTFLGTNKYYNGTAWVDNGLARVGSSFQVQNDGFTFYSFDTGTNFTSRFTVASGGNVGIGVTSAPGALLSVGGTTGNFQVSGLGAITAATTTNTINGLIISSGSLSGITGFTQTSGNFGISGTGTFGTGTGAISLNGVTTVTGTNTLTVSGGLTTLSAGLTLTGATNINTSGAAVINIGTGTATGALTFGSGSNAFSLNSTAFDVSSAGALTGITTITTSGTVTAPTVNATTTFQANGVNGLASLSCTSGNYVNTASIRGGIVTAGVCAGIGLSDQRLKTNIVSLGDDTLDKLKNVNVVSFDFDCSNAYFQQSNTSCDTTHQTGVLAQQLATVFPELTYQDDFGIYHVKYDALAMYDFKATTELAKSIDSSKNATLNTVSTGGTMRLTQGGALQNINGLALTSGGASLVGGLNNNHDGITNAGSISGVTGISAQSINLSATGTDNLLNLTKDGNNVFTVFNSGALQLQLDSAQALAVKAANGDNALVVDTLSGKIRIGSGNSGKTFLFVLDSKSTAGDPDGAVNGAQYYNSDSNKFRCYQNSEWQDCVQTSYSEYTIMSTPGPWVQPHGEIEFPAQNRTWVDFKNANQYRILANLTAPGAASAVCRLQYGTNTDSGNPDWHNLSSASDGGPIHLNGTGALKSDWTPIAKDGKKDTLIRVDCEGGDLQTAPNFSNIRFQVR